MVSVESLVASEVARQVYNFPVVICTYRMVEECVWKVLYYIYNVLTVSE